MTVEYARRALADLEEISAYYRSVAGTEMAAQFIRRVSELTARLERNPMLARPVAGRAGRRVASMIVFPYLVFFDVMGEGSIRVLHFRHTARRPWPKEP